MRRHGSTRRRVSSWWALRVAVIALVTAPVTVLATAAEPAQAAASCPCPVTVNAYDFSSGSGLSNFNFVVNDDNTKLATDPLALSTESNSPIVAEGNQDARTVSLPKGRYLITARSLNHKMWGKYLTLPDDAAADGSLTARIDLTEQSEAHPLPLGKIRVFVFRDNAWTNGAPDTEEGGLAGFTVGLEEQTASPVTVDYNNKPLCSAGNTGAQAGCRTGSDGFLQLNDMGPATYLIDVHPPSGPCNSNPNSAWYQTTTIDGGLQLLAPTEEGADGTGAPGEQLWEPPNNRTAYWFGFVCAPQPFATTGTGEITGTARNWVEWAPYTTGTYNDPVQNPFVALTDSSTDRTVYVGRGDAAGNFDIQAVPPGDYNLAIWDEQLTYIMRFKPVSVAAGQSVDVNDTGDDGSTGIGVSRWFGWLDGHVYKDLNGNGKLDSGEPTIPNTDMDQRWRDGSIKETTVTDPNGYYSYPTAEGGALGRWIVNEQGFARSSAYPGPSIHDQRTGAVTPSCSVVPPATAPANPCLPTDQGGGLLANQLLTEGHRATVDWGKRDYAAGTPGQIVGITYFATTRNEFDARKQAHEDYEPAIPGVSVYLEGLGPDGLPNTGDDVVLNKYVTDHWQQPSASQDPQSGGNSFTQNCNPIMDYTGQDVTSQFSAKIGPNCLEVPLDGEQTKDGAFDGGYAFADYCPAGFDHTDAASGDSVCTADPHRAGSTDPAPLVAGTYLTHVVMPAAAAGTYPSAAPCNPAGDPGNPSPQPKAVSGPFGDRAGAQLNCLYRPVREEDVNVDLGNNFTPFIPDPPCAGDDHLIDKSTLTPRSTFYLVAGAHAPLCDKKLVVLTNGQNANADFHLMTNFRTDPNGQDAADTRTGDIEEPGRVVGQVFDDIYFERDQASPWYGEPRPIPGIPVGIYARVDTVPNASTGQEGGTGPIVTYDANHWRLIKTLTTSADGSYEALLPSTETLNCPIPQGPCPGMYIAIVDDPGTTARPNANYNPNLLTANTPFEVWPGLTDQLDTPVDPISGTACEDPAAPARPEVLQVSTPIVRATGSRQISIQGDFIGSTGTATNASGVRATLTDARNGQVQTLTRGNGGILSWTPGSGSTPDTIVISVPALASTTAVNLSPGTTFRPGPKQLTITTANVNGGVSSVNGLTIHVLGSNGTGANAVGYNPNVVNVPAPPPPSSTSHTLQNAIDAAPAGSVLVLSPGTYNENVLVWKRLRIQGLGVGGIIGAHELQARDPEDPRFNVKGSVIDGRFFQQNATAFDATVAAHPAVLPAFTNGRPSTVLRGADVTVVAQSRAAYDVPSTPGQDNAGFSGARIDGLGLLSGHGDGAGGIQVQASANNLQLTNNVLENNGGVVAGGIGLGQPYVHGSHNNNVRIANDRLIGNGGLTQAGGLGIFYGSDGYEVMGSVVCANFSVNYGAGVAHIGLSPGGRIHDNQIYYNDSVDSGGGLAVESELPVGSASLGDGTGAVDLDRNLIQSNYSGDDGGGLFVLDALDQPINVRNNLIVDNGAGDLGGAMMIDDAAKVAVVNNTVANNVSTASSETSLVGVPHSAGLAAEANDPVWQGDSRYVAQYPNAATRPDFANPIALFNNIFWNNNAYTLDRFGPGATLTSAGFIDFEVHGSTRTADTFTPRYSDLTNGSILGPDGVQRPVPANQGNTSANPGFVAPFVDELTVSGSRLDPQAAAVTITGQDPPVGLTGNYHLSLPAAAAARALAAAASAVVDHGVRCSSTPFPAPVLQAACPAGSLQAPLGVSGADYDGGARPITLTARTRTPWDLGADEATVLP